MNREIHVRFWEGLGVRFPWATQLGRLAMMDEFSILSLLCRRSAFCGASFG